MNSIGFKCFENFRYLCANKNLLGKIQYLHKCTRLLTLYFLHSGHISSKFRYNIQFDLKLTTV